MVQRFNVGGWMIDANYLVGRRFEFTNGAGPDMTFVSARVNGDGTEDVRAHALDGGRRWLPVETIARGIERGVLVESAHGVPFVLGKPGYC